MGFFDNKPKKKGGLFDSKYEPETVMAIVMAV